MIDIIAAAGFGAGTYTLFASSGGLTIGTLTLDTLPAGYNYVLNTATPGQVKLVVTSIAPPTPPSFTNIVATGGTLILSGNGGTPVGNYYVLTATNVTLPSPNWSRIATNQFDGTGLFNLTNPINPAASQLFYRLQVP